MLGMFKRAVLAFVVGSALIAPALASQSSWVTPGAPLTMAALASFLNAAYLSQNSCSSGTAAPTPNSGVPVTFQCWADTTTTPIIIFKRYDGASWVEFSRLNTSTHTWDNRGSFNGLGITETTGALSIASGKTFTVSNTMTLAGTDGHVYTFPSVDGTMAALNIAQTFNAAQTFSAGIVANVAAFGGCTNSGTTICNNGNSANAGTLTITAQNVGALIVGPNGATNPTLNVDTSVPSAANGVNIIASAAGGGVSLRTISSAANEALGLDGKGTGGITLGSNSTGAITLVRATTISQALTYGGVTLNNAVTGTGSMVLSNSPLLQTPNIGVAIGSSLALSGCTIGTDSLCTSGSIGAGNIRSAGQTITSASALALAVGQSGQTNPTLQVDASALNAATGIKIKSSASGSGAALSVITSGLNDALSIDAAGTGGISIGLTSTGPITLGQATTISGALTYGGVTLSNSVTGTGGMVLRVSPSLVTPVLGAATATSINGLTITSTTGTLTVAAGKTATDTSAVGASVLLGATGGGFAAYAGASCTNQFIRSLSAAAAATCATVGNADLANSTITLNAGTGVGLTAPGSMSLGSTYTVGSTSDNVRFNNLGLGVASPSSGGQIATTLGANNITGLLIKRNTDTLPTGNFIDLQNAAAVSLFKVDITGAVAANSLNIVNTANASVFDASTGYRLGGVAAAGNVLRGNGTNFVSATLAASDLSNGVTGTGAVALAANPIITGTLNAATINTSTLLPSSNSTTAIKITKADGVTTIMDFDTTNNRVGINKTPGAFDLDVNGAANFGGAVTLAGGLSAPLPISQGGTGQTTASAARAASGLNIESIHNTGDANVTIAAATRVEQSTTTLTATRTWTLPAANSVNAGQTLVASDAAGAINGANHITLARAGTDTINGATSFDMSAQYQQIILVSDGASKWTINPASGGAGGGTVTSVAAGNCLSGGTITTSGTLTVNCIAPQGRLTLQSGSPMHTSDQVNKSTIYYDCYIGNKVPVYDGTSSPLLTITSCEISTGLDAVTPRAASGNLYDVFAFSNGGTLAICYGPAWSSLTARGTGAGTTELDLTATGRPTNKNALTNCWGSSTGAVNYGTIPANQATYLGTFYATANGQTSVALRPAAASGGAANVVGLWNAYNRKAVVALNQDNQAAYNYTSTTIRAAGGSTSTNKISWVDGLASSYVRARVTGVAYATAVGVANYRCGPGLNSSTAFSGVTGVVQSNFTVGDFVVQCTGSDEEYPQLGFNYFSNNESASGNGTTIGNFNGQNQGMEVWTEY